MLLLSKYMVFNFAYTCFVDQENIQHILSTCVFSTMPGFEKKNVLLTSHLICPATLLYFHVSLCVSNSLLFAWHWEMRMHNSFLLWCRLLCQRPTILYGRVFNYSWIVPVYINIVLRNAKNQFNVLLLNKELCILPS